MKKLWSLFLAAILLLALIPAVSLADEYEAGWGTDYDVGDGRGTLSEALEAAAADSGITYIWLLKDITDAEYTISGGDFVLDLDNCDVTAASGKAAFTVTGTAKVQFEGFDWHVVRFSSAGGFRQRPAPQTGYAGCA